MTSKQNKNEMSIELTGNRLFLFLASFGWTSFFIYHSSLTINEDIGIIFGLLLSSIIVLFILFLAADEKKRYEKSKQWQ